MFSIKYILTFILSAVVATLATVADIESLLVFAFANSSTWDNLVNAFPETGGTGSDIQNMIFTGEDLSDALSLAAQFIEANGALSTADATSILALMFEAMVPIQDALSVITSKKLILIAFPNPFTDTPGTTESVILSDLNHISGSSQELMGAFAHAAPVTTSLIVAQEQLTEDVGRAFQDAIAAYES